MSKVQPGRVSPQAKIKAQISGNGALEGQMYFQIHSCCGQNSFPCHYKTEVFSFFAVSLPGPLSAFFTIKSHPHFFTHDSSIFQWSVGYPRALHLSAFLFSHQLEKNSHVFNGPPPANPVFPYNKNNLKIDSSFIFTDRQDICGDPLQKFCPLHLPSWCLQAGENRKII